MLAHLAIDVVEGLQKPSELVVTIARQAHARLNDQRLSGSSARRRAEIPDRHIGSSGCEIDGDVDHADERVHRD